MSGTTNQRPGLPLAGQPPQLGLLADLAGTWVGNGFSLTALPDFDNRPPSTGPAPFRLRLNSTIETLQFIPIGGKVPNRGVITGFGATTGQPDIQLTGLSYFQRISDFVTNEALHVEPGFWVNIPPTSVLPVQPAATIARLGSIPHGDALLAQGGAFAVPSGPVFAPLSSLPTDSATGAVKGSPYTDPYTNPGALPPNFKPSFVLNPNEALEEDIIGQNIIHTVVLIISTNAVNLTTPAAADPNDPNPGGTLISIPPPTGSIANIPFVTANANATKLDATFWIETVQQADGSTFQQLQYTQTVILSFLGIDWPHIAVATLVKQ